MIVSEHSYTDLQGKKNKQSEKNHKMYSLMRKGTLENAVLEPSILLKWMKSLNKSVVLE